MPENIFVDEWLECLQAHYMHVIRVKDKVTEPSLTYVMRSAGFNDSELAELRVRATAHVDDVGADFVPDLNILDPAPQPPPDEPRIFPVTVDVDPANEASAALVDDESLAADDEVEAAEAEAEPLDETVVEAIPEDDEPEEPQQLSLF